MKGFFILGRRKRKKQPDYSACPRRIDFSIMREIADSVGAVLWVDMTRFSGLVAGKVFEVKYNSVSYADIVTTTSPTEV